jgi:hypothetical protein
MLVNDAPRKIYFEKNAIINIYVTYTNYSLNVGNVNVKLDKGF